MEKIEISTDTKLIELPFNTHTLNVLRNSGYEYVKELAGISPYELRIKVKGFGDSDLTNYILVMEWFELKTGQKILK